MQKPRKKGSGTPGGAAEKAPRLHTTAPPAAPAPEQSRAPATTAPREPLIKLRSYQMPVFMDRATGVIVLHWSRQIGKSYGLAAWAVDRLLSRPGRLVTVLSNSRDNGSEFVRKCEDVCRELDVALSVVDESPDLRYENMRFEVRITVSGKVGRIKVLAANPRTARGFSGDLILDEFAFHEDSAAIWEAAEPILSANPDFLCRIASTGNGRYNMFYRMATGGAFPVNRVSRTDAWRQGVKIYHPVTRAPISPDEARALALDKRAYDQNYELSFADENMALLTHGLISAAEAEDAGVVCEGDWTGAAQDVLLGAIGPLYFGMDVGRTRDLSVIAVIEALGATRILRAVLRLRGMRLPQQQKRLDWALGMPKAKRACIDMTGIGLGLCEYAQEKFGAWRVRGVNFSSSVPMSRRIAAQGRREGERVRVTEHMATQLLERFEDRAIRIPIDTELREDLRKPEKVVSPGGRVSIAAERDGSGHADHFWALALAEEAAATGSAGPFQADRVTRSDVRALGRGRFATAML